MNSEIYDIELSLLEQASENEAFAAVSLNPAVTWAKFILTDDLPNKNNKRVPIEEFSNLIRTGVFMPIKMAVGKINDGHELSSPIGVISHLKQVNNQIHGLAALWERERPEDVQLIKERYANKQPLQLSWEILYSSLTTNEDGVEELRDVNLRATTLVGIPAYAGRTSVIEVASENTQNVEENTLELEQLQAELKTATDSLTAKELELSTLTVELTQLREFKSAIESEREAAQRLASLKQKFAEAGLEKTDEYFADKAAMLLALSSEALDFMIQEMVSFAQVTTASTETASTTKLPPMVSSRNGKPTNTDLVQYLQSRIQKKE